MRTRLRHVIRRLADTVGRMGLVRAVVGRELARLAAEPWSGAVIDGFVHDDCGSAYGLSARDKMDLVERFRRCNAEISSGTSPLVHVVLAREILNIPREVQGVVVECGAWKGASTSSLSVVCAAVGRRLLVCDSFQGLPDDGLQRHAGPHTGVYGYYKEGMFAGCLDEVRENVRACGELSVCEFVPGFFADSLNALHEQIVFAFLDVDLVSSTRDCLRFIWPLLVENGAIFSDDAGDMDVVRVFFDEAWWRENLDSPAPGYVGSGCGLPLNPQCSSIGYSRKSTRFDPAQWRRSPFLHYPDAEA